MAAASVRLMMAAAAAATASLLFRLLVSDWRRKAACISRPSTSIRFINLRWRTEISCGCWYSSPLPTWRFKMTTIRATPTQCFTSIRSRQTLPNDPLIQRLSIDSFNRVGRRHPRHLASNSNEAGWNPAAAVAAAAAAAAAVTTEISSGLMGLVSH